jgi:geranylgeranyl reductase family protein
MRDVIISGAGPVGSYTASLLEKKADVLVLEKSKTIGGKACSGLMPKIFDELVPIKKEWLENKLKGAIAHSPSGKEIEIKGPKDMAYVIDRPRFDKWMAGRVKSEIKTNTPVKSISMGGGVMVNNKFSSRMLIGCDGAQSAVRGHFGIKPKEMLTGLIATTKEEDNSDMFEVWIDKNVVKDGFLWKIPRGKETEYGMLGNKANFRQLEKFFKIKDYRKSAGVIGIGLIKTHFERGLLVGDAACQVKAWSGGGLIFGLVSSKIAAKVALKALKRNDFSEVALSEYEKGWRKILEKHIKQGMLMRRVYRRMGNRVSELFFSDFLKERISKFALTDQFKL